MNTKIGCIIPYPRKSVMIVFIKQNNLRLYLPIYRNIEMY